MAKVDTEKTNVDTEKTTELDPEELVEITVMRAPSDIGRKVFCSVNGVAMLVPCGEPVKIKRKYAEVLKNAQKQSVSANRFSAELIKKAEDAE